MESQKQEKITILLFAKSLDGGTGRFVEDFIRSIDHKKYSTIPVALEKPQYRFISNEVAYFIHTNTYPDVYFPTPIVIVRLIQEIAWLKTIVFASFPSIIVSIDAHCAIISFITRILCRKKIVLISAIHNNLDEVVNKKTTPPLRSIIKRFIRFILKRVDRVVCTSELLSMSVKKRFGLCQLPLTIYCGIPLKKAYTKPHRNPHIIITISRLVEQKDPITLVRAFCGVVEEFPNARLWIVGDGNQRQRVETAISTIGLQKNIKLFGWVQNPGDIIKKADIFILSTKREGFGYVLIEAMNLSKPVICSDAPYGPREILSGGSDGVLVPVGDVSSLTNAMNRLIRDNHAYTALTKRAFFRSRIFSVSSMTRQYENLFTSLLYN